MNTDAHSSSKGNSHDLLDGVKQGVSLRYARDILFLFQSNPKIQINAEVRGIVADKPRDFGKLVFLKMVDASGVIQVVCKRTEVGEEAWKTVKGLNRKSRILARGHVERTKAGEISVIASMLSAPRVTIINTDNLSTSFGDFPLTRQLFLARIRRRAAEFFLEEDFEEFEPQCMEPKCRSEGIEPLKVVFDGWGSPAYLQVSPVPQLMEAVLEFGVPRVFGIGRCFSAAIRDGYTSAESMIACAIAVDAGLDETIELATKATASVFNDLSTRPEVSVDLNSWRRDMRHAAAMNPICREPTVEIVTQPNTAIRDQSQFLEHSVRLLLPPGLAISLPGLAVSECFIYAYDQKLKVGVVTLHLERMLRLVKDLVMHRLRKTTRNQQ